MTSVYSSEERRLKSFRHWPHTTSKTATPPKLAQAGFFHNPTPENPDRCTCFMCGTSLVSWDVTDIPLEEHRKHAKHCEFLQQLTRYNTTNISLYADDPEEQQLDKESSMGLRDCQGLVPSVLLREKNSHFFVDGQRQR
jgi:hypothetical protein